MRQDYCSYCGNYRDVLKGKEYDIYMEGRIEVRNDVMAYLQERSLCPKCIIYLYTRDIGQSNCSDCGKSLYDYNVIYNKENQKYIIDVKLKNFKGVFIEKVKKLICFNCYNNQNKYDICQNCNSLVPKNELYKNIICSNCAVISVGRVLSHNYNLQRLPIYGEKDDYTYGIELEFPIGDKYNRDFLAGLLSYEFPYYNKQYLIKHDGSIMPGFEIVLFPMTRDFLEESDIINKLFTYMSTYIENIGSLIFNHPHCGTHIHVGRDKISKIHLFKLSQFVYENYLNIIFIGQRGINDEYFSHKLRRSIPNQILYPGGHDERYQMLNLTNKNTIEFRFMRGTILKRDIDLYLDFIESLLNFTKEMSITSLIWSKYIQYINNKKNKWKVLKEHCQKYVSYFQDYNKTLIVNTSYNIRREDLEDDNEEEYEEREEDVEEAF